MAGRGGAGRSACVSARSLPACPSHPTQYKPEPKQPIAFRLPVPHGTLSCNIRAPEVPRSICATQRVAETRNCMSVSLIWVRWSGWLSHRGSGCCDGMDCHLAVDEVKEGGI